MTDYACPNFLYKRQLSLSIEFSQICHAHANLLTMPNQGSLEAASLGFDVPISTQPYPFEDMRFIKNKSSVLKLMNDFQHVNDRFVEGKYLRQLVKGEVDPAGTDISGIFVFADGGRGAALVYKNACGAQHWPNNPNT